MYPVSSSTAMLLDPGQPLSFPLEISSCRDFAMTSSPNASFQNFRRFRHPLPPHPPKEMPRVLHCIRNVFAEPDRTSKSSTSLKSLKTSYESLPRLGSLRVSLTLTSKWRLTFDVGSDDRERATETVSVEIFFFFTLNRTENR